MHRIHVNPATLFQHENERKRNKFQATLLGFFRQKKTESKPKVPTLSPVKLKSKLRYIIHSSTGRPYCSRKASLKNYH